jgi:hypothetical protein
LKEQGNEVEQWVRPSNHEGFYAAAEFLNQAEIETEAMQLLTQREQLPIASVYQQEYEDNARTALMEAMTASGHLSKIELQGTLEEINTQVLSRLLKGWDDALPEHEKKRRFAELCNELIIQKILGTVAAGELPETTEILEISDHPEALTGHMLGYRDSNKKGMVRSTSLRKNASGSYTRVIEQASRSNGTWKSTFSFLDACGIEAAPKPADIAVLEKPLVYTRHDYLEGVVDVMRMLDKHAGPGIRYGDSGERALLNIPYENLREESARREEEIEHYISTLAKLEAQLDGWFTNGEISYEERSNIFAGEVERILNAICMLQPEYAADTFGKRVEAKFYEASALIARGQQAQALQLIAGIQNLKDSVTFCGVTMSIQEAQEKGMQINDLGQLVEQGKENWKWKQGVCQVQACPTRPGKTEVGPCNVCRTCQAKFDEGEDPTKEKKSLYRILEEVMSS